MLVEESLARRFPIVFLLDAADGASGTIQVTLELGIANAQQVWRRHSPLTDHLFLGCVLAHPGETPRLRALSTFQPPTWSTGDTCDLGAGLEQVTAIFHHQIIRQRQPGTGDFEPLIVLFLGDRPVAGWQRFIVEATALPVPDGRRPRYYALVTHRDLGHLLRPLAPQVFVMEHPDGQHVSAFFEWFISSVLMMCRAQAFGVAVSLAPLPPGIVSLA